MDQTFRAFVPIDFYKAKVADGTSHRFNGFITTEHKDREGEIALTNGLDFSQFREFGWFNDNHSKSTGDTVGYPLDIRKRKYPDGKNGVWVEGHLIEGHEPAMKIWKLGQALKRAGGKRQLGFSVEGTIQERGGYDNKIITKAIVRNVAITANPVNPYTGMNLLVKSLTAGTAISSPGAVPGEGFPLRTESLEGRKHTDTFSLILKQHGIDPDSEIAKRMRALAPIL
jgi:hypothetical protein